MATTGRIYGTGGQTIGANAWTTPENVNGAATGAIATRNVVGGGAETSAALVTSTAATTINGTVTSVILGARCSTASTPPVEEAFLSIYLTDAAGTVIADWTPVLNVVVTHGDKEGSATLRNGATYADVKTAITTGLTGGAGPIGLYIIARNTGASTTFEVESVWANIGYVPPDSAVGGGASDIGIKRLARMTLMGR